MPDKKAPPPKQQTASGVNRRQLLAGLALTGGVVVAAAVGGPALYRHLTAAPVPEGPIRIGATEEIIPKRFNEKQVADIELNAQEKLQAAPFLFAVRDGRSDLVDNFFTKSSKEAFDACVEEIPELEDLRQDFLAAYPEKFIMSDAVKRFVLPFFMEKAIDRDRTSMEDMIAILLTHGADPFILLNNPEQPPEAVTGVLKLMPRHDDPAHLPLFPGLVELRDQPQGWQRIGAAIEAGVDVNATPRPPLQNIGTALHVRIANEDFDEAVRLIDMMGNRFNPNVTDGEGKTALIIAAKARSTRVVKTLLDNYKGTLDINAQDSDGRTALHYACIYGLPEMAQALIDAGARTDIRDHTLKTAQESLKLPPGQTRDTLASIEISADRDTGAVWNAVITSDYIPFADKNGKAILATKHNIDSLKAEFRKAIKERGNASRDFERQQKDLDFLQRQENAMTGESIMEQCMAGRREVASLLGRMPGASR